MATKEKTKKGLFKSFYKSSSNKKQKPKPQPEAETKITATARNGKPDPLFDSNLLLKKLENFQIVEQDGGCGGGDGDGGRRRVELRRGGGRGGGGGGNMVEARKSVSHIETNVASSVAFLQVKVLVTDMPGHMQVHAFRCARRTYDSLEQFSSKHIAYNIKKEFDKVYGPAWHCIVGSSFGSFVTHSTGCFLYFSMEKLYFLLFKTKVQKASY